MARRRLTDGDRDILRELEADARESGTLADSDPPDADDADDATANAVAIADADAEVLRAVYDREAWQLPPAGPDDSIPW